MPCWPERYSVWERLLAESWSNFKQNCRANQQVPSWYLSQLALHKLQDLSVGYQICYLLDVESCRSHVCLRLWEAGSRKGGGQSCHRWSIMNYPTHNASGDSWSVHWIDRSVSFGCLVFMEFALDRLVDCPACLDIHQMHPLMAHSQHPMTHEKRGPWPHCQAKILTWHSKVVKRCFLQFVGDTHAQVIAVPVSLGPATWGMMLCGQNHPSQVWEIEKQSKNIQKG